MAQKPPPEVRGQGRATSWEPAATGHRGRAYIGVRGRGAAGEGATARAKDREWARVRVAAGRN